MSDTIIFVMMTASRMSRCDFEILSVGIAGDDIMLYQLLLKTFCCDNSKITFEIIDTRNSPIAYVWIDYTMSFGLEHEDRSLITPMEPAHHLPPIKSRSRNKCRNLWVGWCVSSWWPWFWSVYQFYHHMHTMYYCSILSLSDWNETLSKRHIHTKNWCGHDSVSDDTILLFFLLSFKCILIDHLYSRHFWQSTVKHNV